MPAQATALERSNASPGADAVPPAASRQNTADSGGAESANSASSYEMIKASDCEDEAGALVEAQPAEFVPPTDFVTREPSL